MDTDWNKYSLREIIFLFVMDKCGIEKDDKNIIVLSD